MSHHRRFGWLLLLCLASPACRSEVARTEASGDSPTSTGAIKIAPTAETVLATTSGRTSDALSSITDAVLIEDGIAVLDAVDIRVKVFDRRGILQRAAGRLGDGPGEFRLPKALRTCGTENELWVWDAGTNRMVHLGPDGSEVTRVPLPAGVGLLACHGTAIAAGTMTGRLALPTENAYLMPGRIVMLHAGTNDSASDVLIRDTLLAENRPLGAVAAIMLTDSLLLYASGVDRRILRMDWRRHTATTLPLAIQVLPATPASYRASVEASASMMKHESEREMVRKVLNKIPSPDSLPAFRRMTTGWNNELWVTLTPLGAPRSEILVFDAVTGDRLAGVSLLKDADVLSVTRDRLLVRHPDEETGGSTLLVYRMSRP